MTHRIVDLHQAVAGVAAGFGISERCAYKWLARFRTEGAAGLPDRSSRPKCSPRTIEAAAYGTSGGRSVGEPHPLRVARVLALRRRKLPAFQIARAAKLSKASVSRLLCRHADKLAALWPPPPVCRYEREHPGDLIHFDIKKLARIVRTGQRATGDRQRDHTRGAGWEFLHIAIDDHCCSGSLPNALRAKRIRFRVTQSRLAFAQLLPDETARSSILFLHSALAFLAKVGVKAKRIYSDNGSCYRAHAMRETVATLGLKHRFTRPYTPKTNGRSGGGQ